MKLRDDAHKLSPVGWASKLLHFFAESGVFSHSHMRLMLSDSRYSARIPRVLIFLMNYLASCTAPGLMWVTLCTARASGAAAVMSKRQTLSAALAGGSILNSSTLSMEQ